MKTLAKVCWKSPSNIALIKYWGKYGDQYPHNPSLSMTLSNCCTTTQIEVLEKRKNAPDIDFIFTFDGNSEPAFTERLHKYFISVSNRLSCLTSFTLKIESENNFPHSAGIASSASAMSALALALTSIEKELGEKAPGRHIREAAILSRLGSGSATRSCFGEFATWGEIDGIPDTSDEYATPLNFKVNKIFKNLKDTILIIDSEKKKVSSSVGHALMNGHPYAEQRYINARVNLRDLMKVMRAGDFMEFARIVELEALSLHALMMTANPWYTLLAPNTLLAIQAIRNFRQETEIPVCFTLDAGPNVHVIFPASHEKKVKNFIQEKLLPFCSNGRFIADLIGKGPELLLHEFNK